jgi:branched-chain amino acid transport system ATP-binding protein
MPETEEKNSTGILDIQGLDRYFGGLAAVSDLNLSIRAGEFFGLIGPNGSGKTTVFNLISGVLPPTRGKIRFRDMDVTAASPPVIARLGLARTFQITALFHSFTVLENMLLGTYGLVRVNPLASLFNTRKAAATEREQRERALELLAFFGIDRLRDEVARNLPLGHQRILELAMALAGGPKLLLLDEPFSGLSAEEAREMISRIQKIREREITVLLVEHNIRIVMGLCDRIAVLNFGRKIAEGTFGQVSRNPEVIKAYLGTKRYAAESP